MDDDDACPELVSAKVPVTILTGFLGSGKTTLLHHVLTVEHHLKIAVIVNEFEFGKSIEKGLTMKSTKQSDDEWVELDNGCMCCTAQSQAVIALEKLMSRKGSFDLILVETAGLADPAPVAATFWQDDALCGMLYLSGIVTVVDAKNIGKYLEDPEVTTEATRQLLLADRVVMNKMDLVTPEEMAAAEAAVLALNPTASLVRTTMCDIPNLRDILFVNTTHGAAELEKLPPHHHSPTITSVSIELQGGHIASKRALDFLCRDLLYHEGAQPFEVVRCKAAIWGGADASSGAAVLYQLQTIGELFDVREMEGHTVPKGCHRFLILGKNLNIDDLQKVIRLHIPE